MRTDWFKLVHVLLLCIFLVMRFFIGYYRLVMLKRFAVFPHFPYLCPYQQIKLRENEQQHSGYPFRLGHEAFAS